MRLADEPAGSPFSVDFLIREDKFDKIIGALSPPVPYNPRERFPTEPEWEAGRIQIRYDDQSEDRIIYYFYGKNPLIFTKNEILNVRGGIGNPHSQKEHFEIYGINTANIDESSALGILLKRSSVAFGSDYRNFYELGNFDELLKPMRGPIAVD